MEVEQFNKDYAEYLKTLLPPSKCTDIEGHLRKELFGLDEKKLDLTIDPENPKNSAFYEKLKKVVIDAYLNEEISVSRGGEVLGISPYTFRNEAYKYRVYEDVENIETDDLFYLTVKWMWSVPLEEYKFYCPYHKQGIERKIYTILYFKSQYVPFTDKEKIYHSFFTKEDGERRCYISHKEIAEILNCTVCNVIDGLRWLKSYNLVIEHFKQNQSVYFVLLPVRIIEEIYGRKQ